MKRFVTGLIITFGALTLSAGASAQDYGTDNHSYFQDRDHDRDAGGTWDRDRMAREYRGAFYDRLQADLTRAEHSGYLRGDDYGRFAHAQKEVAEFQGKWSRGVFDPHEMDDAIAAVQHVLDIRALHEDDRASLREDLFAMRRFRAHMEGHRY